MLNHNFKEQKFQRNAFKLWWNSLDRFSVGVITIIVAASFVLITTASPAIAYRIGVEPFYFMKRQMVYLIVGMVVMLAMSFAGVNNIKRLAVIGFFLCIEH